MIGEWPTGRLGDYVDSCLGKMLDKEKNRGEFYPYLGNKNVRWGSFDLDELAQMRFEENEHERYGLIYGDLVICEGGEPGRCAIWKEQIPNMKIQKALHRVRSLASLNNYYLHYWFTWAGNNGLLEPYFTGTTIKHLTGKALADLEIPIPPLQIQENIVRILKSLDDKIEINRQINTTLESMAQALFKSWFVDFDPVIDNALAAGSPIPDELSARAQRRQSLRENPDNPHSPLPADIQQLFPSSFVFTEEMGWVPEGWKIGTILDQADLLSGGTPKTAVSEYWDGDIPWVSAKDVSQCRDAFLMQPDRKITTLGLNKSSTKIIEKYSTVIVSRGATTGRLAMFGDSFAMNQTCYALRSKFEAPFYIYCKALDVMSKIVHSAHGSIFNTITTTTFQSTRVIIEAPSVAAAFQDRVEPIFIRILASLDEVESLYKLRELILPELISGKLPMSVVKNRISGEI